MTQTKRRARASIAWAMGASALMLATACSGPTGSTTLDPDADVTIQVWSGQTGPAQDILIDLVAEFEDAHPNVTIDLSSGAPSADLLLQKLSAGFAGNQYPDVSYAYGRWASQLEASGRTLDISDVVADPDVNWEDFTQASRETVQPTGEAIIGFPAVVDNIGLFYNKTLFDRAGVEYPTDDWTWDDFRDAAKALTDESDQVFGYGTTVAGTGSAAFQFWPRLWQNGGEILSADGTEAAFDSQAGVDALEHLRSMAVDDKSVYLDQTGDKYLPLFISNRVAMVTSGPWNLSDLKAGGTDYGVVDLPGTDGDHQTVAGPDFWALLDHKDANRAHWATEFTNWLTQAEQDERFNVGVGNLPLRTSELESEAVQAQAAEFPGYDKFVANNANVQHAMPTVPGYEALSVAVGKAISAVLQGQGDAKSALEEAAKTADAALAE